VQQGEPMTDRSGQPLAPIVNGALLRHFLQERWKGLTSVMWGDQLRQARLDQLIYLDTLGIDLLPEPLTHKPPDNAELVTEHPAIATEYHQS
jgi:glycerol-3-phosphate dehydrogenase